MEVEDKKKLERLVFVIPRLTSVPGNLLLGAGAVKSEFVIGRPIK
jgi:hypothetical protein